MLGPDLAAMLPTLRAQAESMLVDTGELQARTGSSTNATTGARVDAWTAYWSGPMRSRVPLQGQQNTAGGQDVTVSRPQVQIPTSATVPDVGHRVVLTASADASLVGVPLYVRHVQTGTHLVMRRLEVAFEQG